jgi:hypothetical protein
MDIDPLRLALAGSSIALAALVLAFGLRAQRRVRALVGVTALVTVLGWVYSETFPSAVQTRGDAETVVLVISYLSMVLGMAAHYVYAKAEQGATRLTIEWLPFLMPILVSPIVFIPLVTIAGEVGGGGAFTHAKLMVYLVAFQNGFFWKHFFDQRRAAVPASSTAPQI